MLCFGKKSKPAKGAGREAYLLSQKTKAGSKVPPFCLIHLSFAQVTHRVCFGPHHHLTLVRSFDDCDGSS